MISPIRIVEGLLAAEAALDCHGLGRPMWEVLMEHFRSYPAQERVVRLMIGQGLSIGTTGTIHMMAGTVELADTAVARAASVDRRIVRATVETIAADPRLREVFSNTRPALALRDVARHLGCGVIEVIPEDPERAGILAAVSGVIAAEGISIRQAIGEDSAFTEQAKLHVITEGQVPEEIIPLLQAIPGVRGVRVS